MKKLLVCWLGETDVQAIQSSDDNGPIAKAVNGIPLDEVHIISDLGKDNNSRYANWLSDRTSSKIEINNVNFSGPAKVNNVSAATVEVVDKIKASCQDKALLIFHQNSGEPIMGEVLADLAESRYLPAALIESSIEQGKEGVTLRLERSDAKIRASIFDKAWENLFSGPTFDALKVSQITCQSPAMRKALTRALAVAQHSEVTVLIEGESGSGKEGLAKLIHEASPRKGKPFIPLNCGAIPSGLIESELFGYAAGAFNEAKKYKKGNFEAANGGTLFLDEIGELPLQGQVKLLRVLQEGKVTPVGDTNPKKIDVRIIAATNKTLAEEVGSGKFRSDLFYRLAVGIIEVPPLRDRKEDIDPIADEILKDINEKSAAIQGFNSKKLSYSARYLILNYPWPGNVRELQNTLKRAAIWCSGDTIDEQDIREAIITLPFGGNGVQTGTPGDSLMDRPLGNGFSLRKLQAEVMHHYLRRALEEANGIKTLAANLVDLPNHQTFSSWMKKYDVEL
jgi:transcriptional regulator with PAS, ATPase and Fis domain